MFIKSNRWLVNIKFEHEERRKQCDRHIEDLKEATGASLKQLQEM
jgi:hypothetical protein